MVEFLQTCAGIVFGIWMGLILAIIGFFLPVYGIYRLFKGPIDRVLGL